MTDWGEGFAIPKPQKRQKATRRGLKSKPVQRAGVSTALRNHVLRRDGICIVKRYWPKHQCRDQWGDPMTSTDRSKLSLDHVHLDGGQMGKRAPDDEGNLCAMCPYFNIYGPYSDEEVTWDMVRDAERSYLKEIYG